jgi:signal transduction histidine kinase
MRFIILFLFLSSTVLYSQRIDLDEKISSVSYFSFLSNSNTGLKHKNARYSEVKKIDDTIKGVNAKISVNASVNQVGNLKKVFNFTSEQEKTSRFSSIISIVGLALISILSLLSIYLYKANSNIARLNLLLEEEKKALILAKETAETASSAKSDFLSTVSHELRTPLNAINTIAYLLLEEKPKKSQINYLTSLQFSGNYLTNYINDILEINKIDSKKVEIENINFNLKLLLENIRNSLKELASTNNNDLKIEIDDNIPNSIIGDPTKLSQILMNLINNAIKFTANGHVNVIVKLNSIEDKTAAVLFEVKDNGIGIPEDKLESVFDSFSQGSIEINKKYGGSGLGLTIVKKLVEILGGSVHLDSVVDQGSSFTFELPFKIDIKPVTVAKKKVFATNSALIGKKILLVEDNKINQMITKKMLENKGIHCEIVDNGEESVKISKNQSFDLILMDIHLPGINGTIATEKIREFDSTTPIIALTAISLNENKKNLLACGMNDVITKPFLPDDFYATITKYI